MYKPASVVVSDIEKRLGSISSNWQKGAVAGATKWQNWYDIVKNRLESFLSSKAGQTLDRAGMESLIEEIKNASLEYRTRR